MQPNNPEQQPQQPGQPYPHTVVTKGGISAVGHAVHAVLTVCTLGLWAPIWFLHWLFTRNKTVSRVR
jgi:hypothetical protein